MQLLPREMRFTGSSPDMSKDINEMTEAEKNLEIARLAYPQHKVYIVKTTGEVRVEEVCHQGFTRDMRVDYYKNLHDLADCLLLLLREKARESNDER